MVAALNAPDYQSAALCGACLEVTGPNGSVTVRGVDPSFELSSTLVTVQEISSNSHGVSLMGLMPDGLASALVGEATKTIRAKAAAS